MKAIIDGKRYDTGTAEEIASTGGGRGHNPRSDFHRWEQTMYRTKRGAWFVHSIGGALTEWREQCADGWSWGETIRALSPDEARAMLEEWNAVEALEEHFASEVEDA